MANFYDALESLYSLDNQAIEYLEGKVEKTKTKNEQYLAELFMLKRGFEALSQSMDKNGAKTEYKRLKTQFLAFCEEIARKEQKWLVVNQDMHVQFGINVDTEDPAPTDERNKELAGRISKVVAAYKQIFINLKKELTICDISRMTAEEYLSRTDSPTTPQSSNTVSIGSSSSTVYTLNSSSTI